MLRSVVVPALALTGLLTLGATALPGASAHASETPSVTAQAASAHADMPQAGPRTSSGSASDGTDPDPSAPTPPRTTNNADGGSTTVAPPQNGSDSGSSDPTPGGTPTPTPQPPRITAPADGRLIRGSAVTVTGTAAAGDTVTVRADADEGTASRDCGTVQVDADGNFSCTLRSLPGGPKTGPDWTITVTDGDESATVSVGVLTAPVVSYAGNPQVVTGGQVTGSGAYPDAIVRVTSPALPGDRNCQVRADRNGSWACDFRPPSHPAVGDGPTRTGILVTQTITWHDDEVSSAAGSYTVWFDRSPPPAPAVTSPHGTVHTTTGKSIRFSGTGATTAPPAIVQIRTGSGANAAILCATQVKQGRWSCSGGGYLKTGSYRLSAVQLDEIGNASSATGGITVVVDAPSSATHGGGHGSTDAPTPGTSSPVAPHRHTPSPTPSAPAPSTSAPTGGAHGGDPIGPGRNLIGDTPLTATAAPALSLTAFPGWLRALLLAGTAVLLLAVPARLLASSLATAGSGPVRAGAHTLFGRNRSRAERDAAVETPSSILPVAAGTIAAAAVLVALAWSAPSTAAFLQLAMASLIAVCAVNAVWLVIGRRMGAHLLGRPATMTVLPWMLAITAVTVLVSRTAGMQPGLIFALVVALAPAERGDRRQDGLTAAAQVIGTTVLGVLAWLLTAIPDGGPAVPPMVGDLLNAVAIIAVGSAGIALLPIGRMPGRAVFSWSRWVWLAVALAVGTVLFALLVPVDSVWRSGSGGLLFFAVGIGFAALSTAVWLWTRYIEPRI